MNLDEGPIYEHNVQVQLPSNGLEDGINDPRLYPAVESLVDGDPLAKVGREVSPGSAGPRNPQDTFEGVAVALDVGTAIAAAFRREQGLDTFPLGI